MMVLYYYGNTFNVMDSLPNILYYVLMSVTTGKTALPVLMF